MISLYFPIKIWYFRSVWTTSHIYHQNSMHHKRSPFPPVFFRFWKPSFAMAFTVNRARHFQIYFSLEFFNGILQFLDYSKSRHFCNHRIQNKFESGFEIGKADKKLHFNAKVLCSKFCYKRADGLRVDSGRTDRQTDRQIDGRTHKDKTKSMSPPSAPMDPTLLV